MADVEEATAVLDSALLLAGEQTPATDDDKNADVAALASQAEQLLSGGQVDEAIPLLEEALLHGGKEDPEMRSVLWNMLGNAHFRRHDFRKATYCHLHDLASCREAGDGEGCTKAYANLGLAFKHMGRYEQAGQCFTSQLRSCERRRHQAGIARAFNNLAQLTTAMAKAELAKERRQHGSVSSTGSDGQSSVMSHLNDRAKELLAKAIDYYKRHLLVVQKQRDSMAEGRVHGNIAGCYEILSKFGKAVEHHTRRLAMAEEAGDLEGMSRAHCNLGNCLRTLHEYEEAIEHYQQDLSLSEELGDEAGQAITQRNMANTYDMMGSFDLSLEWHAKNLEMVKKLRQRNEQILALGYMASLHEDMHQFDEAIGRYTDQLEIYRQAKSDEGQEQASANIQRVHNLRRRQMEGLVTAAAPGSPRTLKGTTLIDTMHRIKRGTVRLFSRKDRHSVLAKGESVWVTDIETPPQRRRTAYKMGAVRSPTLGSSGYVALRQDPSSAALPTRNVELALEAVLRSSAEGEGKLFSSQSNDNFTFKPGLDSVNIDDGDDSETTGLTIYSHKFGGAQHVRELERGVGAFQDVFHENPLFNAFHPQGWQAWMNSSAETSMMVARSESTAIDQSLFESAS